MLKISVLFALFALAGFSARAQEDSMLNALDQKVPPSEFVDATFKSSRLVNFHTVETTGKHTLDLKISHRFGNLSGGLNTFFGIDGPADIRIGLEYSPDGRIQAGIGRTSYQKTYDGFLKYKLLRQRYDNWSPVTVTLLASMFITSDKDPTAAFTGYDHYQYFTSRMSYNYQVLIARKFSEKLSVQIAPTMIHYNLVENITDKNDLFAAVGMVRYKFTKRMAIGAEYAYRLSKYSANMSQYHNSLGVSLEIETGGHVFQIIATNSFGLIESQTIGYTTNDILKGQMMIGFNIGRFFTL
jgi:hypothetical protein